MSEPCDVVLVQSPATEHVYPAVAQMLQAEGIRFTIVDGDAALRLEPALLGSLKVLVAPSRARVDRDLMKSAPQLRAIVSPFTGTEGIDEASASESGILVAFGQIDENFTSMAEGTILLILAALYDFEGTRRVLTAGETRPQPLRARMLKGRVVGFFGFGRIASAIYTRLSGWDVEFLATTRRPERLPAAIEALDVGTLVKSADVLVITASLNAETRNLFTFELLSQLKRDAVFINVARGAIVDEDAIYQVARQRPDLRIALDVFQIEPLPLDSPLRELPKAILTPHMIGHTRDTHDKLPVTLFDNITRVLRGELPVHLRNREISEDWLNRYANEAPK